MVTEIKNIVDLNARNEIRICSNHFSDDDFFICENFQRLKPQAVPHLLLTSNVDCESKAFANGNVQHISTNETHACVQTDFTINNIENLKEQIELLKNENVRLFKENQEMKDIVTRILNADQIACLKHNTSQGCKWSNETLVKAYKLKFTCGSVGYDALRELIYPLPSRRTLHRKIEHLKFCPGILSDVLGQFKIKTDLMKEEEKHCVLLLDEMGISPKYDYDPSTGLVLGKPTIPSSNGRFEELATHGLVYMLAGVTTRWKQIVGYQLTGNSFNPYFVKKDLINIIGEVEKIGLKVDAVVSDMGGQNLAIWKLFEIHVGRYTTIKNYCTHPIDPKRKLFFSPDPPHILKNLRDTLTNGQKIYISHDFLSKYNLPDAPVDINYIREVLDMDNQVELKIAPYLKESCLTPSHFDKMNVGLACRLINHDTAAALKYYIGKKKILREALVTAWFIEKIDKWFKTITNRSILTEIKKDSIHFQNSKEMFNEIIDLFNSLKVGPRGVWKPIQTGVILASTNAIQLSEYYIMEKGFHFVCMGRFVQDALENLFSMVRYINPVPSPKYFKMALRLISVAQFFRPNKRGNYSVDDSEYLVEFLTNKNNITLLEEENEEHFIALDYVENLKDDEVQSLYYICGRTVHQCIKIKKIECTTCLKAIKTLGNDSSISNYKTLTECKAYSEGITFATRNVTEMLKKAEYFLRKYESALLRSEINMQKILDLFISMQNKFYLPTCHNIEHELLKIYFKARIYFMLKHNNDILAKSRREPTKCDSKSLAMRRAVDNIM